MKKIVLILVFIVLVKGIYAQVTAKDSTDHVFVASVGFRQLFMNDGQFDTWTETNYNKKINLYSAVALDLGYYTKKYDGGIDISGTNSTYFLDLYFGERLTSKASNISSYLNLFVGGFQFNSYDIKPIDYTLTPDQVGKKLKLNYGMYYFGLSSKTYFNKLHTCIGKHKKVSLNSGFYVNAGYDPFNDRIWEYGYEDNANSGIDSNGDITTPFKSVTIHNIPLLNRFFMEAGIFIGIGN